MIDLHIHSTASDGTFSPEETIYAAKKAGLTAISLTDHDSVAGIEQAQKTALQERVELIPGIEFSSKKDHFDLHILGYFIDWKSQKLEQILTDLRQSRLKRAEKIVAKLNSLGFKLNLGEVKVKAKDGAIGRPHIALALVKKGLIPDVKTAFDLYLANGKPAYVEKKILSVKEVIYLIHELKGLAVLAHPGLIKATPERLKHLILELVNLGLDGLELYHPEHTDEQRAFFTALAQEHDLAETGGSDCHGLAKPTGFNIGSLNIPDAILSELKNRLHTSG